MNFPRIARFFAFLLATEVAFAASLSAQCTHQFDFDLGDGELLTGMSVGPSSDAVLVSTGKKSGDVSEGRIRLFSLKDGTSDTVLDFNDGTILSDPDFNADETKIAVAGFCRSEKHPCWKRWPGWNIFSYDLTDKSVTLLTRPNLHRVQWRPKYGDDGHVYFVAFEFADQREINNASGGSLMRPSAVFQASEGGSSTPVLPTISKSPRGPYIGHPGANFRQLRVLSAANGVITISGSINSDIDYVQSLMDIYEDRGDVFEKRMIDLAYRVFAEGPEAAATRILSSVSHRMIFFATDQEVKFLNEFQHQGAPVPKADPVAHAAMIDESLWVSFAYASGHSLLEFFKITGDQSVLLDLRNIIPEERVIDLRIGKSLAAILEDESGALSLQVFDGFDRIETTAQLEEMARGGEWGMTCEHDEGLQ